MGGESDRAAIERGEEGFSAKQCHQEWYVAANPACKYNKMKFLNSYSNRPTVTGAESQYILIDHTHIMT